MQGGHQVLLKSVTWVALLKILQPGGGDVVETAADNVS
jgi:hypothetical protein